MVAKGAIKHKVAERAEIKHKVSKRDAQKVLALQGLFAHLFFSRERALYFVNRGSLNSFQK